MPRLIIPVALICGLMWSGCAPRTLVLSDSNVLLIVIDSLRADHVGIYGYGRPTSPTIDRLASEGLWFERVVAQGGWTRPAIGSLLTSLYPGAHGAVSERTTLSDSVETLAETMRSAGYVTFAVQTNPFLLGRRARSFAQGFDSYVEVVRARGSTVVGRFRNQLDRLQPPRFFAYVHLMDAHLPYDAPESYRRLFEDEYTGSTFQEHRIRSRDRRVARTRPLSVADRQHIINLYDAGIREADSYVAGLLEVLRARNRLDSTLVVLTSDHGEELFDRGSFEHGHSLHGEITRVPLIMSHPGLPQGIRIAQLVRHVDIYPTIVGLAGAAPPPVLSGRDLRPAMADPSLDWASPGFTESVLEGEFRQAVEQGRYKAISFTPGPGGAPAGEGAAPQASMVRLYDLVQDPGEQRPLADGHPERGRLMVLLRAMEATAAASRVTPAPDEIDKERLEQLRSLGYAR